MLIGYARVSKADGSQSLDLQRDALIASGLVRRKRDGVRLLGRGEVTQALTIEVTGASKSAIAAVEKAGGSVTVLAPAKAAAESDAE